MVFLPYSATCLVGKVSIIYHKMKEKILFFGGSGFVGIYFAKKLLELGYKVIVYDLKKPKISHKNLKYIIGNILDSKKVQQSIKKNSVNL